jgi:hypothetical protein
MPAATVAAATADVPADSLTPAGRDYLHEALAAPDAATVRRLWQDARVAGAVPEYLQQIADVGRQKSATEQQQAGPAPYSLSDAIGAAGGIDGAFTEAAAAALSGDPEPSDDVPDAEHAAAEAELRAFATEAGIGDIDRDAYGALGAPLADVFPAAIRGLLNQLRGTAA